MTENIVYDNIYTRCTVVPRGSLRSDIVPAIITFVVGVVWAPVSYILILVLHSPVVVMVGTLRHFRADSVRNVSSVFVLLSPLILVPLCLSTILVAAVSIISLLPGAVYLRRSGRSLRVSREYMSKWVIHKHRIDDLARCYIGVFHRHGWECLYAIPNMLVITPLYKLFLLNPLLRDLSHIHINQTSQPLRFTTIQNKRLWIELVKTVRSKHAEFLNHITFMGFYPTSPHRRTLGMQMGRRGSITFIVWAENTLELKTHRPRSRVSLPLTSVHIDALNPYHFLTGYVEVNITNRNELEHPMWLIGDVSSRFTNRQLCSINETFAEIYSNVIVFFTGTFHAKRTS